MRAAVVALGLAVLACIAGEAAAKPVKPATVSVAIENMKYAPAEAIAKVGDTVVWTNKDVVAHTVTGPAGSFDSKIIPPGGTWKYVVRKKGDVAYHCTYHQPMTGTLKVR